MTRLQELKFALELWERARKDGCYLTQKELDFVERVIKYLGKLIFAEEIELLRA